MARLSRPRNLEGVIVLATERETIDYNQGRAYGVVRKALLKGEIIKPEFCPECGQTGRIEAHHDDYNRPREYRWLCRKCHAGLHSRNKQIGQAQLVRAMTVAG